MGSSGDEGPGRAELRKRQSPATQVIVACGFWAAAERRGRQCTEPIGIEKRGKRMKNNQKERVATPGVYLTGRVIPYFWTVSVPSGTVWKGVRVALL